MWYRLLNPPVTNAIFPLTKPLIILLLLNYKLVKVQNLSNHVSQDVIKVDFHPVNFVSSAPNFYLCNEWLLVQKHKYHLFTKLHNLNSPPSIIELNVTMELCFSSSAVGKPEDVIEYTMNIYNLRSILNSWNKWEQIQTYGKQSWLMENLIRIRIQHAEMEFLGEGELKGKRLRI